MELKEFFTIEFFTPFSPFTPCAKTKTMNMEENNKTPSNEHGECCEECKRTCKRNFWTTVLQTFIKVGTAVLAAFGLASGVADD